MASHFLLDIPFLFLPEMIISAKACFRVDAPQSLKFGRVNQTHHQAAFVSIGAKADDVVNRIAIDAFAQVA